MKSRNEIDFLRLLKCCQKIADQKGWRLEKYVDALNEKLDKLRNQNVNHLTRDTLEEYGRKIQFLRGLIETEKLPSAEKRLLAAELLAPDRETKSTHLITTNKYHEQMRQELLLSNRSRFGNSRGENKRRKLDNGNNDVDEDITQNLRELANNIRENMHAANAIIQKDTETISNAAGGADTATLRVQRNTNRLTEFYRKGQAVIWLWLILVTCTFLMIVVFIRLCPKPQAN